jgi:phosphatidylglycerophosphatase A
MPCCGANSVVGRLAVWLATGLGVGLSFPAPGTIGGLWGVPLALAIHRLPHPYWQWGAIALLLVAAAGVCSLAASEMGAAKDPGAIVLDEIVVLPIVFLATDVLTWPMLVAGYLSFRLFDVWKPGPVGWAERLPRGWGIVADDVVAAFIALSFLHLIVHFDETWGLHWLATAA